jgi:hypothetical protein
MSVPAKTLHIWTCRNDSGGPLRDLILKTEEVCQDEHFFLEGMIGIGAIIPKIVMNYSDSQTVRVASFDDSFDTNQ